MTTVDAPVVATMVSNSSPSEERSHINHGAASAEMAVSIYGGTDSATLRLDSGVRHSVRGGHGPCAPLSDRCRMARALAVTGARWTIAGPLGRRCGTGRGNPALDPEFLAKLRGRYVKGPSSVSSLRRPKLAKDHRPPLSGSRTIGTGTGPALRQPPRLRPRLLAARLQRASLGCSPANSPPGTGAH
jgi:hypothetical protein